MFILAGQHELGFHLGNDLKAEKLITYTTNTQSYPCHLFNEVVNLFN